MSLVRAVVCSGGASRGAAQAGALQVLLEAGVVPDLLVGTSVGAINASFLAADPSPERARCLIEIWQELRTRDVFPTSAGGQLVHLALRSDHLCSTPLRASVDKTTVRAPGTQTCGLRKSPPPPARLTHRGGSPRGLGTRPGSSPEVTPRQATTRQWHGNGVVDG